MKTSQVFETPEDYKLQTTWNMSLPREKSRPQHETCIFSDFNGCFMFFLQNPACPKCLGSKHRLKSSTTTTALDPPTVPRCEFRHQVGIQTSAAVMASWSYPIKTWWFLPPHQKGYLKLGLGSQLKLLWKMLLLSGFVDVLTFGELTTWPQQTHQMVNARTILRASRLNEALFRRIHRMHWELALGFLQEMGTIESRKGSSSMLKGLSYMNHRYLSTDSKDRNWDTSPKLFQSKAHSWIIQTNHSTP